MEKISYQTTGVCSKEIRFSIQNDIVRGVEFKRGCQGNLPGIGSIVEGMPVNEVIKRLKGINCQGKGTSCPDQLARAMEEFSISGA